MARIKKYAPTLRENLTTFQTFIVDINPNSDYFRISEFKETLTGGKNGFQIEGSEHLLETTEIKIEILDVDSNPIYYEPGDGIPEYYEGISKIVSVHIYEDTPIGEAIVTVLGELKTYIDADGVVRDVPTEWKGVYNCKWERRVKINKFLSNEDKVRFYKRPKVSITEITKPLFSNVVTSKTNTGTVTGIPLVPIAGTNLNQYTLPTSYLLKITDIGDYSAWTGSVVGNTISVPSINYTTNAQEVINKTELIVTTPYTENGLVSSFTNKAYTTTFNYTEGVDNLATALTGSFAKITLTDLTSFVGDVARVKVFRKSQTDLSDFQFVQEIQLESNELLVDLATTTKNQENYGLFTTDIINNYWIESSPNITATYNQAYLYDSAKLDSTSGPNYFYTTEYIPITKDVEYTLDFNIRLGSNASTNNYVRVFLSGSLSGGTIQVEQDITTITSSDSLLQKTISTDNIKAQEIENARLYFEVVGSNWYIANVSLKASKETAFSPDEITFIQPVPRSLPIQTFVYRFEFYDINNNYVPVLVEKEKTFNGGNLQTIQKSLQLVPSSIYFQFDSGSNPVPPTIIDIKVVKTLLTGSVNYTSESIDFDGTTLTPLMYASGQYPGLLTNITSDNPYLTVQNFTGSRLDKNVQYLSITGECEGYTDTVVITKVLDGFGGVNHIIRPYRGTQIRNSSTASLEIQAIRIDGVNDIELSSTTGKAKGWNTYQLHVLSASLNPLTEPEKFINLQKAVDQKFITGVSAGELGSKELNYNAIFNRDSINKTRVIYLMSSGSNTDQPAYIASASVLASITLEDLQDGLDAGFFTYNTDVFTINPRTQTIFTPVSASVTGSFYKRGTNAEAFTASFEVFPSMSLNADYAAEYWLYYVTGGFHKNISVRAIDDKKNVIPSRAVNSYTGLTNQQSKTLTVTLTYKEDYTSASISIDKTFTIVPEGKPGDETVVFEVTPANVVLNANSKGTVLDYKPSITDIKLKQGSRYLIFTGSGAAGTFHIATSSISFQNIKPGNVHFTSSFGVNYTASLIVSQSSNFTQLSGSISFPLNIHPYYTSSIYTQSIVQNYTKAVDGPPPIDVIISPASVTLISDEVGYISDYTTANTTILVKEGSDYLTYSTSTQPGTYKIESIVTSNIQNESLAGTANPTEAFAKFNSFDYPYVSASATYNVVVYPNSLGPGHIYTSSVVERIQSFTKNVSPAAARSVKLTATTTTINFDGDGQVTSPIDSVTLTATAFNLTGSGYFRLLKDDVEKQPVQIGTTTNTKVYSYTGADLADSGNSSNWVVELRDGSATDILRATDSLTFTGVRGGSNGYSTYLTNQNSSVVYTVQGTTTLTGTGTQIVAKKGTTSLVHKSTFSAQTLDQNGNEIGSLGEYRVTIFSKSAHLSLAGGLVSGSVVPTVSDIAVIGDLAAWSAPNTNLSGEIVYKVDIENGKGTFFLTQSLSVQLEGRYGPGIVFRGPWDATVDQYYFDPTIGRRDAVLFGGTGGSYYAAKSGSGDTTYLNPLTSTYFSGSLANANAGGYTTYLNYKTPGVDTDYWELLGTQELFVAAKIAIFEESYVKNTINVGTNALGSAANIILYGNVNRPYISLGQTGTIGYGQTGFWVGTYGSPSVVARMSLVNAGDTNHMNWDGTTLDIKGSITVTGGDAATQTYATTAASASAAVVDTKVFTDATGKLAKTPSESAAGLYLGSTYMGYYNGSAWKTYMANNGNFYLSGTGASSLTWNGTTLQINGDITATSGTFSGTINASGGTFTGYVTGGTSRFGKDVQPSSKNGIWINADNYWYDSGTEYKVGNADNYMLWDGSNITFQRGGGGSSNNPAVWVDGDGIAASYAALYVTDGGLRVANTYGANGGHAIDCVGRLNASGDIRASGNITAYYSDERLKAKLGNIDNAVDKISQLNGFYYTNNELANSFGYTDTKTQLGLSAQEVQSVFPDIVSLAPFDMGDIGIESKSGENYLTIDYSKLVPVLVEAIKELKAEIEELKRNK